jgi:hypothetical protein
MVTSQVSEQTEIWMGNMNESRKQFFFWCYTKYFKQK